MRDAFIAEFHEIAKSHPETLLLTADIGFKVFDRYRADFPDRFVNMGVAESNMIGVAAGMALTGKRPWVYTIIPFLTMRAFEQIRVDVCLQNQPVKIVGVGGGLAYGILGPTHHSIEDMAILRALPNMTVIAPCDPLETGKAIRAAFEHPGPVYVRLGKNGEPVLHKEPYPFQIGRAVPMRRGSDATLAVAGTVTRIGLEAAEQLSKSGVQVQVLNFHTIKPIDSAAILQAAQETRAIVSLEEHSTIGGLGSALAEVLAENSAGVPFQRIGIPDRFCHGVGSQEYHLAHQGLTVEKVSQTVLRLLEKKQAALV